ncbi:YigZ family protein, partial [Cribrihabitans sp. XS_ASV171]
MRQLTRLGVVLSDRGSKYAVTGAPVTSREDIDTVLAELKQDRAYAK